MARRKHYYGLCRLKVSWEKSRRARCRKNRIRATIRKQKLSFAAGTFCSWSSNENLMLRTTPRHKQRLSVKPPLQLPKWYTAIFGTNPRCAHPSCLRLLPSPRTVRSENSKGTMAVGANDLRVGSKEVRSFISSNRGVIYPLHRPRPPYMIDFSVSVTEPPFVKTRRCIDVSIYLFS